MIVQKFRRSKKVRLTPESEPCSTLGQWCTDTKILQSDWIGNFFINSISNPYPKIKNCWIWYPTQIRNYPLSCTSAKIFGSVYFSSWGKSCGYFAFSLAWLVSVVTWQVWYAQAWAQL